MPTMEPYNCIIKSSLLTEDSEKTPLGLVCSEMEKKSPSYISVPDNHNENTDIKYVKMLIWKKIPVCSSSGQSHHTTKYLWAITDTLSIKGLN